MRRFLVKHIGNMGDMIFFVPPVLATLKRHYPDCHITFVTAWGFKDTRGRWGARNQGGFCISLMKTDPHIDTLVHWHDTKLSLEKEICREGDESFATWNKAYFEEQKKSGGYDAVYELDFGLKIDDNPIRRMYEALGMPQEDNYHYKIYLTADELSIARLVMENYPRPRIMLLEGLEGTTTRGWDPTKIPRLEQQILAKYGVAPLWFGAKHVRYFEGRELTLRENIALLTQADVGIGVMSGPIHFAAAVGLPTLTLFCDQPLHRAAPAYFLNRYISDEKKLHRTLLGPTGEESQFLKNDQPSLNLTPAEASTQGAVNWQHPGRQSTKTCLSVITVDEVMAVLADFFN